MAAILPFLPSIISGGSAIASALLARNNNKPTENQQRQRELVDQLMASLKGNGPFNDLFNANEDTFNKSFRDPALSNFKNRTVPAIQQGYIGGQYGQQRGGTGLEDTLTRAGVDMDQLLNQHYANFQQNAQNNQIGGINAILNQGAGPSQTPGIGESIRQGAQGFLQGYPSTTSGQKDIQGILDYFKNQNGQPDKEPKTNGFEG